MPQFTLAITLNENGQMRVDGIPQSKVLAYGMLAAAQDAIRDAFKQQESRIVAPPPGLVMPT